MWVSHFPHLSVFLPYSSSYSVQFSCFTFFSVSCHFQVLQCALLFFTLFGVYRHIPDYTVFVSHFPPFSIFSPYSMSYILHFDIFRFFTVSHPNPDPTVCVAHFDHFLEFLTTFLSYHVSFSFSSFVSFLAIFQFLQCAIFIFHVFSVSRHIPGPTVYTSHFSRYSVFLATFQVIQCLCLIFHLFFFSRHILLPTVFILTFSRISLFLTTIQIIEYVFLILHVFHIFWQNPGPPLFHIFHVFHCFSSQSRSYSVCFSFCTFFRVSHHISFLPCEFLIFLICQFSCHIPVPTVCNFHFSRF